MSLRVDLNCDMGESFGRWELGDDREMMRYITSANVACGFHAGDPRVIDRTVRMAKEHGVAVGAHPGFPDLVGFGRRDIALTPEEAYTDTLYQIAAVAGFCKVHGVLLQHVKPHGQINNLAFHDAALAGAIVRAVQAFDPNLILICQAFSEMGRQAEAAGLPVAWEVYADRAYTAKGTLVSRKQAGAVIHDAGLAAARVVRMVQTGRVTAVTGEELELPVQTVCIHGDTHGAAEVAAAVRRGLEAAGVQVQPLGA